MHMFRARWSLVLVIAAAAVLSFVSPVGAAGVGPGSGTGTVYRVTFTISGTTWTCEGVRFENRQIVRDAEGCLISGDTASVVTGTFSGDPYGDFMGHPNSSWASDFDGQIATHWTVTVSDNGDGGFWLNVLAYYSDATESVGAAMPYAMAFESGGMNWSCTGARIATSKIVKDSETCLISGDTSSIVAGTFSGDPSGPLFGRPHARWASDFDLRAATNWTITFIDNGDGTWTAHIVAYYS